MKIEQLVEYVKNRLHLDEWQAIDSSLNGLQFSRPQKEVKKVVCAVDASLATFEKAAQLKADAIFVHHGLFWGQPLSVTESHYRRLEVLFKNDIALIATHLPLDAHPSLGNNATMASLLNLEQVEPFGLYKGKFIGYKGTFPTAVEIDFITQRLNLSEQTGLKVLPFGKEKIKSVGIVSGGAPNEVLEAIDLGLDAYITGETSHTMYAYCLEAQINMICGGHYATEVFGVQQMARDFAENLNLETTFIDLPTSL